jgi:hypothetical protein
VESFGIPPSNSKLESQGCQWEEVPGQGALNVQEALGAGTPGKSQRPVLLLPAIEFAAPQAAHLFVGSQQFGKRALRIDFAVFEHDDVIGTL